MDIEQAYEAMINDIFWDGKAVGVCLSLPIITEINDVLSDMSEDERNAMKLHYGLTGEKPLSSLLVAGVLGTKKPNAEEILVRARKHFIERLIYERNFDVELFMMSRQELLNAAYEAGDCLIELEISYLHVCLPIRQVFYLSLKCHGQHVRNVVLSKRHIGDTSLCQVGNGVVVDMVRVCVVICSEQVLRRIGIIV